MIDYTPSSKAARDCMLMLSAFMQEPFHRLGFGGRSVVFINQFASFLDDFEPLVSFSSSFSSPSIDGNSVIGQQVPRLSEAKGTSIMLVFGGSLRLSVSVGLLAYCVAIVWVDQCRL